MPETTRTARRQIKNRHKEKVRGAIVHGRLKNALVRYRALAHLLEYPDRFLDIPERDLLALKRFRNRYLLKFCSFPELEAEEVQQLDSDVRSLLEPENDFVPAPQPQSETFRGLSIE